MTGRRNKALPDSGVRGVNWSAAHDRWVVKFKVNGRDIYRGLYADLDEARRVHDAARLENPDPHGRGHEDTTAHLTDAGIAERFALDDEGDPLWREKPLEGDEATIRDNARWNSRHGGKKLDERAKFNLGDDDDRRAKLMWRTDIIARLVAMRDKQGDGILQDDDTAAESPEDAPEDAVSPDRKQGDGIPQAGAYEAALSEALAIEDVLERERKAKPLEGLIIPPTPIAKGPLARVLMAAKRAYGLRQQDLRVLSIGKDPFHQDTPLGHALGRWLRVRLDLHAPRRVIHLRGVHYLLVAVQAVKPDGERYQNTKDDYFWLNDRVAKAARWLRYIPFDRIVDERNEEAVIARAPRTHAAISAAYVTTGYSGVTLPDPLTIHRAKPLPLLSGFRAEQRFCFAVFGEKSSLSEVLAPFAERHGADLFIATGELSERRAYEMARDASRDGRKLICLTFSDFDPSGYQMPVSIAVKLMAQRELQFPEFEFAVQPVALTLEDVVRLRLPTAMVEKKDKRVGMWQRTFAPPLIEAGLLTQAQVDQGGLAQVEIDALTAINPDELTRMAEAAIAPYLDPTLTERTQEAVRAWALEALDALERGVDWARLDMLSHAERLAANRFNGLLRSLARTKGRIDAIESEMGVLAANVELPPVPEPPEAHERSETAAPLVDSDWGYLGMVEAMKARKKYEDES